MAKQGFKILDCDMHVMEPPDLWERYIDAKYKSKAPRGITSENVRDLRMVYPDGRDGRAEDDSAKPVTSGSVRGLRRTGRNHRQAGHR